MKNKNENKLGIPFLEFNPLFSFKNNKNEKIVFVIEKKSMIKHYCTSKPSIIRNKGWTPAIDISLKIEYKGALYKTKIFGLKKDPIILDKEKEYNIEIETFYQVSKCNNVITYIFQYSDIRGNRYEQTFGFYDSHPEKEISSSSPRLI